MFADWDFTMDTYLPIISHLKEIASFYKRTGKLPEEPDDCFSSPTRTNDMSTRDQVKDENFRLSRSVESFQPIMCCGLTLLYPSHVTRHSKSIYHSTRLERTCSICAKHFKTKAALQTHQIEHDSPSKSRCEVCGWSFKTKRSLSVHMRKDHISLFSVKCAKCPYETWKSSYLAKHMIKFHKHQPPASQNSFKPVKCCGIIFKAPSHLKRHREGSTHRQLSTCGLCQESFVGKEALELHKMDSHNMSSDGRWICMICSATFATNGCLTTHLKSNHIKSTVFECGKCSFSTTRKDRLSRHFKTFHCDTKPSFSCDTCGRKFLRKDTLTQHIRNIHLSNSSYCEICFLKCNSVEAIERHKLVHRPCQICGMKFETNKQRERHCKSHIKNETLKWRNKDKKK